MKIMGKLVMWCGKRRRFPVVAEQGGGVRKGHVRVVVGSGESKEVEEFEMEVNELNHPLLEKLLSLTGEEYGYSYKGALRIACDIHLFRYLLQLINNT